jgi:hypothetical protein
MRGRNNNHRKGPNPLTRTYESNGPDVKIRGTAHHVAEKYLQLARDAQSSGDPVMAESYLQHAEHYFRLIAAAQLAQQQAQMGAQRPPGEGSEADDVDDDEDFGGLPDRFASPIERQPAPQQFQPNGQQQPQGNYPNQPQPYGDRPPQGERQGERPYQDRNDRNQGERNNQGDRQYQDRGPRQDRQFNDRNNNRNRNNNRDYNRDNNQNRNNGPRDYQPEAPRFDSQPEPQINRAPAIEPDVPVGLPSFITAPVRTVMPDAPQPVEAAPNAPIETGAELEEASFHLRNRRRRRPKAAANGDGEIPQSDEVPAGE